MNVSEGRGERSGDTGASTPDLTFTGVNVTTTMTDSGPGLLLRISVEDGNYSVTDFVGTRYGFAPYLMDALEAWMSQVNDILGMQNEHLGPPLSFEVAAYKKALAR